VRIEILRARARSILGKEGGDSTQLHPKIGVGLAIPDLRKLGGSSSKGRFLDQETIITGSKREGWGWRGWRRIACIVSRPVSPLLLALSSGRVSKGIPYLRLQVRKKGRQKRNSRST